MLTTLKTITGLSALLSAGFVSAVDHLASAESAPVAAATKILDRHPAMGGSEAPATATARAAYATVSTKKDDRLGIAGCAGEAWPYISSECRVSRTGERIREVTRTITIEQRLGDNTSVLLRLPAQMAQY